MKNYQKSVPKVIRAHANSMMARKQFMRNKKEDKGTMSKKFEKFVTSKLQMPNNKLSWAILSLGLSSFAKKYGK